MILHDSSIEDLVSIYIGKQESYITIMHIDKKVTDHCNFLETQFLQELPSVIYITFIATVLTCKGISSTDIKIWMIFVLKADQLGNCNSLI